MKLQQPTVAKLCMTVKRFQDWKLVQGILHAGTENETRISTLILYHYYCHFTLSFSHHLTYVACYILYLYHKTPKAGTIFFATSLHRTFMGKCKYVFGQSYKVDNTKTHTKKTKKWPSKSFKNRSCSPGFQSKENDTQGNNNSCPSCQHLRVFPAAEQGGFSPSGQQFPRPSSVPNPFPAGEEAAPGHRRGCGPNNTPRKSNVHRTSEVTLQPI